jgi:uncharacterized protein
MPFEVPVVFHSHGVPLVGRIFRNSPTLIERQPAVIVTGSWLTVKEQMASTYARRLADAGYTTLAFDFAGFGQSHGEPRQAEIPSRKIRDIISAAEFLQSLAFVHPDRIGALAICASAQYTLRALAERAPIRSFVSVAGWYHDPASVAPFYGGDAGVRMRIDRGSRAVEEYGRSGKVLMAPAYKDGDDRAGMYFRLDYYGQADRGAVPAWKNEMAEMTWFYWLTFDGLSVANRVSTPTLFVHSDGAVFPQNVKQIQAQLTGPAELVWTEGDQIDFYDRPSQVDQAVSAATNWFGKTLRG